MDIQADRVHFWTQRRPAGCADWRLPTGGGAVLLRAKSRDERKKVEMRFARLKTHHRFERMRRRGRSGARDEFHLAAIVQNLKTLVNQPCRPPPDAQVASVT